MGVASSDSLAIQERGLGVEARPREDRRLVRTIKTWRKWCGILQLGNMALVGYRLTGLKSDRYSTRVILVTRTLKSERSRGQRHTPSAPLLWKKLVGRGLYGLPFNLS